MWQFLAALVVWAALCAVSSPRELMPVDGRDQFFGEQATIGLFPSTGEYESDFGERPPVIEENPMIWHLTWNGQSYDLISEAAPEDNGNTLAFRRLSDARPLYIVQLSPPAVTPDDSGSQQEAKSRNEYVLLWRLSADEFIGYTGIFWPEECEVVPAEVLRGLGMSDDAIDRCEVRSWQQLEGLMRAFADVHPEAAGIMRKL